MIKKDEFLHILRAGLVTDLYNRKKIWPLFGCEGESFSHGVYIAWL